MSSHALRDLLSRVRARLADSPWGKTAGRAAGYLVAFALLALVGSGRLARWLSPPPRMGIAVAEAAAPPTTSSAPVEPAASAGTTEIVVPTTEVVVPAAEAAAAVQAPTEGDGGAPSPGVAPDGKIILNLASEEDLRKLPGVGRGRAQAILALRVRLKKFTRVEDLLKVKGIGRRGLARLRPLVRVD
jgi:competence protein ComEA